MKLQKFLGGALLTCMVSLFATAVYAADGISFGKPIDLKTNAEVTDYTEGMIIAVPVDIVSNTGKIDSFSIKATGAEGFTPGATSAELGDSLTNLRARANKLVATSGTLYVASNIKMDDGFDISYPGTYDVAIAGNKISTGWMNAQHIDVNASEPELYLIYKVTAVPTGLNADVATVVDGECSFSDTSSGQGKTAPTPENEAKANATQGAFKVVLKAENLTKYVKSMAVEYNGNTEDITEYVKISDTEYEFPVRVNKTDGSTEDIEVTVYGMCYSDLAASAGEEVIELAKGTISMNGSVTDYAELKN